MKMNDNFNRRHFLQLAGAGIVLGVAGEQQFTAQKGLF